MNYIIKFNGYTLKELHGDYSLFSKEISERLSLFYERIISQNNKTKKYKDIIFYITPEIGLNTMVFSWLYFNNVKSILYIPNFEGNDIEKLKEILKKDYGYTDKKIDMFLIIYNKLKQKELLTISNKDIDCNLLCSLWFGENDNHIFEKIKKANDKGISLYDIYNMEVIKKLDI